MGDHAVGKVRDPEKVDTLLKEVEGWAKVSAVHCLGNYA